MRKRVFRGLRHPFAATLLATIAAVSSAQGRPGTPEKWSAADSALAVATFDSAWSRIRSTYYDTTFRGTDWTGVRDELRPRVVQAKRVSDVRNAIEAMFERLGESHFALIPAETAARDSDRSETVDDPAEGGALGDVGLDLRLVDGRVLVSRIVPGSSAAESQVRTGWEVERVGGVHVTRALIDIAAMRPSAEKRRRLLQLPLRLMAATMGATGTTASVVVRDDRGRRVDVALERRASSAETVRYGILPPLLVRFESERVVTDGGCIGVIRFNAWMTPVMPRLDDAVRDLRECAGLVLDLRGNVGGVAAMAMGVGSYFVDTTSLIGTLRSRGMELRYAAEPRRADRGGRPMSPYGGPLAILVDRLSVSTTELFAAAMQTHGRARLFGEATPGEVLPATVVRLPNGDIMEHVIADFAAPDGRRLEGAGVLPDVHIPLRRDALRDGRDEAMLAAVTWLRQVSGRVTAAGTSPR